MSIFIATNSKDEQLYSNKPNYNVILLQQTQKMSVNMTIEIIENKFVFFGCHEPYLEHYHK